MYGAVRGERTVSEGRGVEEEICVSVYADR